MKDRSEIILLMETGPFIWSMVTSLSDSFDKESSRVTGHIIVKAAASPSWESGHLVDFFNKFDLILPLFLLIKGTCVR